MFSQRSAKTRWNNFSLFMFFLKARSWRNSITHWLSFAISYIVLFFRFRTSLKIGRPISPTSSSPTKPLLSPHPQPKRPTSPYSTPSIFSPSPCKYPHSLDNVTPPLTPSGPVVAWYRSEVGCDLGRASEWPWSRLEMSGCWWLRRCSMAPIRYRTILSGWEHGGESSGGNIGRK